MKEREIWKQPEDFPKYEISNLGRVRNAATKFIYSTYKSDRGYQRIALYYARGKRKIWQVHRLVMLAFVGKPEKNQVINHKNGVKTDNRLANLEYVTQKENIAHSIHVLKTFTGRPPILNRLQVRIIKRLIKDEIKVKQIANYFQLPVGTITSIKYGQCWKQEKI